MLRQLASGPAGFDVASELGASAGCVRGGGCKRIAALGGILRVRIL